jgi:penicillin-binding protein 2
LRGEDGEIVQIKSATGDIEEQKVFRNFVPGNNLILTIDADLQLAAAKAMADKTGGLIAIRPFTGEILAIVSKPDFDPNILIALDNPDRADHIRKVQEEKAELNRAISTKVPAGVDLQTAGGACGSRRESGFQNQTVTIAPVSLC